MNSLWASKKIFPETLHCTFIQSPRAHHRHKENNLISERKMNKILLRACTHTHTSACEMWSEVKSWVISLSFLLRILRWVRYKKKVRSYLFLRVKWKRKALYRQQFPLKTQDYDLGHYVEIHCYCFNGGKWNTCGCRSLPAGAKTRSRWNTRSSHMHKVSHIFFL